jgi:hypothetical protein
MKNRQPSLMIHTNPEFETSNLILDFEFDQHLESHKHVINIIMRFRDMGCYKPSPRGLAPVSQDTSPVGPSSRLTASPAPPSPPDPVAPPVQPAPINHKFHNFHSGPSLPATGLRFAHQLGQLQGFWIIIQHTCLDDGNY